MRVVVVGRGGLGTVLASALRRAGVSVRVRPGRSRSAVLAHRGDVVLITTPDTHLGEVARRLEPSHATRFDDVVVLHCAGGHGPELLATLRDRGAQVGVMHPMVSFIRARKPAGFEGSTFVVHGDRRAVAAARTLARTLGARVSARDVHGAAYHGAVALAANGAVGLAHAAKQTLVGLGIPPRDAERALAGLLASVAENVRAAGLPAALTGPVVRGDVGAVERHRTALRASDAAVADAYDAVLPVIVGCAADRGLDPAARRALLRMVTGPSEVTPRRRRSRTRSGANATRLPRP